MNKIATGSRPQTNTNGADIASLQKALEKAFKRNELSKMPIGPIGMYAKKIFNIK
jgi:hypothetical protein